MIKQSIASCLDRYPAAKQSLKKYILPKYLWMRSLKYKGQEKYCPCCGGQFSRFLDTGPQTQDLECPRCRSLDRDRFFWIYLEQHPDLLKPGIRLLHISPETIYYNRFRKIPQVRYTAGDKFVLQFGNTYPKDTVYVDITDMPQFEDGRFDFIYCSHVLEYIHEDKKALKELHRVLKPGGHAIVSVPINHGHSQTQEDYSITDPEEQKRLYGDTGHVRYYGEDYEERVREAGFRTRFIPVTSFIKKELIKKCNINPKDLVHLCYKTAMFIQLFICQLCEMDLPYLATIDL